MAAARKRQEGETGRRGSPPRRDDGQADADRAAALARFVDYALGDPRLTTWEANFVNSMRQLAQAGHALLTEKQRAVVEQISEKIGFERPARVPMPGEANPDELEVVDLGVPLDLLDDDAGHGFAEAAEEAVGWGA